MNVKVLVLSLLFVCACEAARVFVLDGFPATPEAPVKTNNAPVQFVPVKSHYHLAQGRAARESILEKLASGEAVAVNDVSLASSISGYMTTISIGGQPQVVLVDTGSSDLLVPANLCADYECGEHVYPPYNPELSTESGTYACTKYCPACQDQVCIFEDGYGDGTELAGAVFTDTVTWGSWTTPSASFGAILYQNTPAAFPYSINGILGLAFQALSSYNGVPLLDNLIAATSASDIFAMCLTTTVGGTMSLGGVDNSMYTGTIQYTPLEQDLYYNVALNGLQVNGQSISLPSSVTQSTNNAIVDSGTTLIYLNQVVYEPMMEAITALLCKPGSTTSSSVICNTDSKYAAYNNVFETCIPKTEFKQYPVGMFPSITFEFAGGLALELTAADYLLDFGDCFWFGIQNGGSSTSEPMIFGDTLMRNFLVVFDRANSRIGFASQPECGCQTEPLELPNNEIVSGYTLVGCPLSFALELPAGAFTDPSTTIEVVVCNVDTTNAFEVVAGTEGKTAWTTTVAPSTSTTDTNCVSHSFSLASSFSGHSTATTFDITVTGRGASDSSSNPPNYYTSDYVMLAFISTVPAPLTNGVTTTGLVAAPAVAPFTLPIGAAVLGAYFNATTSGGSITLNAYGSQSSVNLGEAFTWVSYSELPEEAFSISATPDPASNVWEYEVTATAYTQLAESVMVTGLVDSVRGVNSYVYFSCDATATVVLNISFVCPQPTSSSTDPACYAPGTFNYYPFDWTKGFLGGSGAGLFNYNAVYLSASSSRPLAYIIEVSSAFEAGMSQDSPFMYYLTASMVDATMQSVKNNTAVTGTLCAGCCGHFVMKLPLDPVHAVSVKGNVPVFLSCNSTSPSAAMNEGNGTDFVSDASVCSVLNEVGERYLYFSVYNTMSSESMDYSFTVSVDGGRLIAIWLVIVLFCAGGGLVCCGLGFIAWWCTATSRASRRRGYAPMPETDGPPVRRNNIQGM